MLNYQSPKSRRLTEVRNVGEGKSKKSSGGQREGGGETGAMGREEARVGREARSKET